MIDWESDNDDNCHPDGGPQVPNFDDVLAVAAEIRKLGHKVALVYTGWSYWSEHGKPTMSGHGFDLVNARYGAGNLVGTAEERYQAQGGDSGLGWGAYGGLTPVLWQFGDKITWGNRNLDMNAYRGDPNLLNKWFTTWKESVMYPYAYSGTMLTMEELENKLTVKNAHPEFWKRVKAMLEAGQGRLGIGTLWRSSDIQRTTFLNRHYTVSSGGCCYYEGRRYQLKKGMAHAAPPGKSFHESTFHGYAAAGDMIGDLAWMHSVEADYGLKDFRNVGSEPWHIQFAELPNSVSQWKAAGSPPPQVWQLPGTSKPVPPEPTGPPPPLPEGNHDMMAMVGKYPNQGVWVVSLDGGYTHKAIRNSDWANSIIVGGAIDAKSKKVVTAWSQVPGMTSTEEVTKYLGTKTG
jgi:hypothetical protein